MGDWIGEVGREARFFFFLLLLLFLFCVLLLFCFFVSFCIISMFFYMFLFYVWVLVFFVFFVCVWVFSEFWSAPIFFPSTVSSELLEAAVIHNALRAARMAWCSGGPTAPRTIHTYF